MGADTGFEDLDADTSRQILEEAGKFASDIVHLVLCRLPDAPAGNKGLSLMVAPKFLPDGSRNKIRCDGIEKKMGIKGSATSAMSFEGATGWLVGEPHKGLGTQCAGCLAASGRRLVCRQSQSCPIWCAVAAA